ncbi:hypothetical protein OEB94_08695 [Streptomyces sp. ICN988]|uniref:hypothetical protein n=1 Tax=Streptomyces sp. ICN988 TaxID=2983765 RepID=UPI0021E47648|nr:hypothetical protein [Streptomyces sp. ICN988]MCV2459345.1 hypothetical protein [Streptomyces sp. ICN988]
MGVDAERECWEMRSGAGVGPLQFGMSPAEVAQALLVPEPQERAGGPYAQEDFPDGVKAFYDAGKLACVALTDIGVLLRSQQVGAARLTRPLFAKEEWLESEYFRDHLPLEGASG